MNTWWEHKDLEDVDWGTIWGIAGIAVCGMVIGGAFVLLVR